MATRFINVDRATPMLLPVDMREWVPNDDMVHFVIEAVDNIDLGEAQVNWRGTGNAQYPPSMMVALLIYCYSHGIFSSRKIEKATYRDVAVRYLTGDTHPDHDTIATFRRRNGQLFERCFVQVLEMASEVGVLKLGTVSIDGTKMKANANKYRNVTYGRCQELLEELEKEVRELVKRSEQVDAKEKDNGDELPKKLRGARNLKRKLERAKAVMERRAKARFAEQQQAYEAKVKARNERKGRRKGGKPKPPIEGPKATDRVNLTDGESRLMRPSKNSSYIQAYNPQAVVDADGSQLVVGARVSVCANDKNELEEDLERVPESLGQPERVLVDNGYENMDQIEKIEKGQGEEKGPKVYCSMGRGRERWRARHDLKSSKPQKPPKEIKEPRREAMAKRMDSESAKEIYKKRQQTVEPVFGIIKEVLGFRRFHMRGISKVETEWQLVCLSYNFKRFFNLMENKSGLKKA